jgi:hypothetical protein
MEHAAETYDQLMVLLSPQFEAFTNGMQDLKSSLSDIQGKLEEIHDQNINTSNRVTRLEERSADHDIRIKDLETSNLDNKNGVSDYKKFKAWALAAIGAAVTLISTIATWGVSTYLEEARHREEMAIKQAEEKQYKDLLSQVESLKKMMKEGSK